MFGHYRWLVCVFEGCILEHLAAIKSHGLSVVGYDKAFTELFRGVKVALSHTLVYHTLRLWFDVDYIRSFFNLVAHVLFLAYHCWVL